MKAWNRIAIMGYLAASPELSKTKGGKTVAHFPVATDHYTTHEGELVRKPDYHRIVAWEKIAESCNQYLTKGDPVYLEGRVQYRSFETADKQPRYITEITLDQIQFLSNGKESGEKNGNGKKTTKKAELAKVAA